MWLPHPPYGQPQALVLILIAQMDSESRPPSWRLSWGLQFLRPFQTPLYLHSLCCKIHGKGASHPPHISSKEASWSPKVALAGTREQNFTCQTCTHHKPHTTPQGHSLHLCDIPGTSPQDTDTSAIPHSTWDLPGTQMSKSAAWGLLPMAPSSASGGPHSCPPGRKPCASTMTLLG